MEFLIVLLNFAAALWTAWRSQVRTALWLFASALTLTIALFLHHATDALPLSF
jgi:hypothetical protein